jgi:YidC/Oxa1 family membrane protein insertase
VSTHQLAGTFPVFGSVLGQLFHPLYLAMAWIMAASYTLVPNYAVAIALLTIVVMAASAPLTVKSIRSAQAMQRLQPELKKLQQKYKGDRIRLNEAMLALYHKHGLSPAGAFLPALLQIPVFVVLYGVIRGLTHTVQDGRVAAPLYVNPTTHLARSLHAQPGHMQAFGINLSSGFLSAHAAWFAYLPYAVLVLAAIGLQFLQTRQLNKGAPALTSQARALSWIPLAFGVVYLGFPAALVIYVVVSTACRMAIQWFALRSARQTRGQWSLPWRLPPDLRSP